MSRLENSKVSCGAYELVQLSDGPEELVSHVAYAYHERHDRFTFVIFSDRAAARSAGTKFAKFIEDNQLGTLVCTDSEVNRNSQRRIKVWIWTPAVSKLKAYLPKTGSQTEIQDRWDDNTGRWVPEEVEVDLYGDEVDAWNDVDFGDLGYA